MAKNEEQDVPRSNEYEFGPVLKSNFNEKPDVHIFWGPGQKTTDYPNYTPPDKKEWRNKEFLNIPRVARFIYSSKDDYDYNEYSDDDGGVTPPPSNEWTYEYNILWGLYPHLKPSFRDPTQFNGAAYPFAIIPPYYDEVEIYGDLGAGVMWNPVGSARQFYSNISRNGEGMNGTALNPIRVTVRNSDGSGSPYFQGSIKDCPFFDMCVWRSVIWIKRRTDNPSFTLFVASVESVNDPGTDPLQPPRCEFLPYQYYPQVPRSEYPIPEYSGPC